MDKARHLAADCIIMDLEDATAPDAKPAARELVLDEIRKGGFGHREIVIRVNGLTTTWGREDVIAAARSGADAVLLPKVESTAEVQEVQQLLAEHGAPPGLDIWIMIETPLGVLHVADICRGLCNPPIAGAEKGPNALTALCLGFADLGKELHAPQTPGRPHIDEAQRWTPTSPLNSNPGPNP